MAGPARLWISHHVVRLPRWKSFDRRLRRKRMVDLRCSSFGFATVVGGFVNGLHGDVADRGGGARDRLCYLHDHASVEFLCRLHPRACARNRPCAMA